MATALREVIQRLASAHDRGTPLALLFDYDGTLTPIVEHPSLAQLDPATRRLLQCLARLPRVGVGILSGRGLTDLRHLVGLPGLYYAGASGLELDLRGTRRTHPRALGQRHLVAAIVRSLDEVAMHFKGAWVEDRHLGLSLHHRQVAPDQVEALWEQTAKVLLDIKGKVRVDRGAMVWEITPHLNWDKGTALRFIVEAVGKSALPIYAGDGANDRPAIEAVHALDGISIGVGEDAPEAARHRLNDAVELVGFLSELVEALRGERPIQEGRSSTARCRAGSVV